MGSSSSYRFICSKSGWFSLNVSVRPGNFFSVDEVAVQEMAQAVYQHRNLEVPPIPTTLQGFNSAFYARRGPALGYAAVPFVAVANFLDDHFGSVQGTVATGIPRGILQQPLRWGGRLA